MATVSWRSYLPSGTSALNLGDNDIVNNFQAIGSALSDEHYFTPEAGSADRGLHTPNASRISYAGAGSTPTTVSDKTGLMFIQSSGNFDAFAFVPVAASELSFVIGGRRVITAEATPSAGQKWVLSRATGDSGSAIAYGVTYADAPFVVASTVSSAAQIATIQTIGVSSATVDAYTAAGVAATGQEVHVIAYGPVDL